MHKSGTHVKVSLEHFGAKCLFASVCTWSFLLQQSVNKTALPRMHTTPLWARQIFCISSTWKCLFLQILCDFSVCSELPFPSGNKIGLFFHLSNFCRQWELPQANIFVLLIFFPLHHKPKQTQPKNNKQKFTSLPFQVKRENESHLLLTLRG